MKLNTDNRDTMPITDAVYGQGRAKPGPEKAQRPDQSGLLWRKLPIEVLDQLARRGTKESRKLAEQRRGQ